MTSNNKNNSTTLLKDLIYGISHDMGAPVRHAIQFSSMLETSASDRLTDKEKEWLNFIHDGGVKAQSQLAALLTISRLETNTQKAEPISLQQLISEATNPLLKQHPNATFNVLVKESSNRQPTLIKKQWLLLIQELVKNALTFQPTNNNTHHPTVLITADYQEPIVTLVIDDNGIGIPEGQRESVFRAFKTLHGDQFPGIGMGLTTVNFIAQSNDGHLHFDNSSLGGTKVIYTQSTNENLGDSEPIT